MARIQSQSVGDALPEDALEKATRPDEVARQSFDVGRRGFNQNQVRAYLAAVAEALADAQNREAEIRSRLGKAIRRAEAAEAKNRRSAQRPTPEPAELTRELGDHVAAVIDAAHAAGDDKIAAAQVSAEEILSGAEQHAAEVRTSADRILLEKSAAADAAAADIVAQAEAAAAVTQDEARSRADEMRRNAIADVERTKAECDALIREAEEARAQVLADLERRRRQARAQVERLRVGRDRLLRSYEIVRRNLDESTVELKTSLQEAKVLGDTAARNIASEPLRDPRQLEDELADSKLLRSTPPRSAAPPKRDKKRTPSSGPRVPIAKAAPEPEPKPTEVETPMPASREAPKVERIKAPGPIDPPKVWTAKSDKTAPTPKRPRIGAPAIARPPARPQTRQTIGATATTDSVMRTDEAAPTSGDLTDESTVAATPVESPPVPDVVEDLDFSGLPEGELAVIDLSDEIEQVILLVDGQPVAEMSTEVESPAVSDQVLAGEDAAVDDTSPDAHPDADPSADLFAALRSDEATDSASEVDGDADVSVERESQHDPARRAEALCAQRDAVVAELNGEMHKRLKRALADEQNDVLAGIRSARCLTDLVGDPDRHTNHYLAAMRQVAALAYGAGVALIDESAEAGAPPAGAVEEIVTNDIVVPLRLRLIELDALETDGPAMHVDAIRAFYRQRKTDHLGDVAAKLTTLLVNAGACDALPDGSMAPWVAAPSGA